MRVLGIDPGSRIVGYACLETRTDPVRTVPESPIRNLLRPGFKSRSLSLVDAGIFRLGPSSTGIETRLLRLADCLDECIQELRPDAIAVEEAFYGKSVPSALRLGEARGVVLLLAARNGLRLAQYPPATIKLRVAGNGRSSKDGMAKILATEFGPRVAELPTDASDALAIALCYLLEEQRRNAAELGG